MTKLWQGKRTAEEGGEAPGPVRPVTRYSFCRHPACARGAAALAAATRREANRLGLALKLENTLTVCDGNCSSGPFVGLPELEMFYHGVAVSEVRAMLEETSLRGKPVFKRLYLDPTVVTDSRLVYERHEGLLVAIEPGYCLLDAVTYLLEFNAAESCGKCFPCRLGAPRMSRILERIMTGQAADEDLAELEELALTMAEASYCQFAGRVSAPVRLALELARGEFERHLATQGCRPGERRLRPET